MCGWGRTSTPAPGGKRTGPMWSKKTNGPTMRRAIDGSVRRTEKPPRSRSCAWTTTSIDADGPSSTGITPRRSENPEGAQAAFDDRDLLRVHELRQRARLGEQSQADERQADLDAHRAADGVGAGRVKEVLVSEDGARVQRDDGRVDADHRAQLQVELAVLHVAQA